MNNQDKKDNERFNQAVSPERVKEIINRVWMDSFSSKYLPIKLQQEDPSLCTQCNKKPRKFYAYTGFIAPAIFVLNRPVCIKCWSLLYGNAPTLYVETNDYYEKVVDHVRRECIENVSSVALGIFREYSIRFEKTVAEFQKVIEMQNERIQQYKEKLKDSHNEDVNEENMKLN